MKEETLNALDAFVREVVAFSLNVASQNPQLHLLPFASEVLKTGKDLRDALQEEVL